MIKFLSRKSDPSRVAVRIVQAAEAWHWSWGNEVFNRWKTSFQILGDDCHFYWVLNVCLRFSGFPRCQDRDFAWISGFSGFGIPVLSTPISHKCVHLVLLACCIQPSPRGKICLRDKKRHQRPGCGRRFLQGKSGWWFLSVNLNQPWPNQSFQMFKSCSVHGVHYAQQTSTFAPWQTSSCQVKRYWKWQFIQKYWAAKRIWNFWNKWSKTAAMPRWNSSSDRPKVQQDGLSAPLAQSWVPKVHKWCIISKKVEYFSNFSKINVFSCLLCSPKSCIAVII